MPTRTLPDRPSLEHLRNQAKSLQREVRAGDPEAIAQVVEFDPRNGRTHYAAFTLAEAQLVVARSYEFTSWTRLRTFVDELTVHATAFRHPTPVNDLPPGLEQDPAALADHFLNLACLTYGGDGYWRQQRARALMAAHPDLATASIHTMAVVGDVDGVRRLLARDPAQASRSGGPYDWEPLLYLTYSRTYDAGPGRSTVEVARLLLDAGADPNAGYLWRASTDMCVFTALTGAFGGGEELQSPHPESAALARVLLEAGADPNDVQTLYNRTFFPPNDHLELLFEFGLGTDIDSPWRRRRGTTLGQIRSHLQDQLCWATERGFAARVRLLLDHGVDPGVGGEHPTNAGRTPCQLAMRAGHRDIAEMLVQAGATPTTVDPVEEFLGAC
ncbi:MAG: ankyrin repeat domain-containing protein, partial [Actinopolymorphaceae bacterium]